MNELEKIKRQRELRYSIFGLIVVVIVGFIVIDWNFFYGLFTSHTPKHTVVVSQLPEAPTNILSIPSLGITAPVNYPTDTSSTTIETTLQTGLAHYPNTALPGQRGSVYIFGHSSDFVWSPGNFKHVFTTLPHIAIGATITVSDSAGKLFTYVVSSKKIVSAQNTSVLAQDDSLHQLVLQTSYPLGTALERYVVFAQLQQ